MHARHVPSPPAGTWFGTPARDTSSTMPMKGITRNLLMLFCIALSGFVGAQKVSVTINGAEVHFPRLQPQIKNGKVYVPLRGIFESLGAVVNYNEKTKYIQVVKENESIELWIGRKTANKNGAEITMDATPFLRNGTAMVPLRFLAEALRANVDWNGSTNTVEIKTDEPKEDERGTTGGG